jgi:hypothetical protein
MSFPRKRTAVRDIFVLRSEGVAALGNSGYIPERQLKNHRGRNMFRISRLHELMKGFPRAEFDRLVCEHQADKHNKGFDSWSQLVAMVYAQLSGAGALRELVAGFNAHGTHHYHLGSAPLRRSTLAEANARRTPAVFVGAAHALMTMAARRHRQRCAELLYLLLTTGRWSRAPGAPRASSCMCCSAVASPCRWRTVSPPPTSMTSTRR